MSISRQNLTVVIVTFKSENVIHDCIQSIDQNIFNNYKIIIDNSNNKKFKENIEKNIKMYPYFHHKKNLGWEQEII